jgi:hypothetical protein
MKFINYLKLQFAKLTGKATKVEYLAMPVTGLTYEFLFRINGGKWEEGRITVQQQYTTMGKSPVQIHFETLKEGYYEWTGRGNSRKVVRITGPAYFDVLRNKKKIIQAMDSITKQYGMEL